MIHYCQLKPKPYLGLLSLRPVSSFPCQGPIENHVTLTWRASLGPTWLWAPHTFFFDSFEEFGHLFDRMPPTGACLMFSHD